MVAFLSLPSFLLQAASDKNTPDQTSIARHGGLPHLAAVDVLVVSPSVAQWNDRRTRLREQFPRNMQLAPNNTSAILKFSVGNLTEVDLLEAVQMEHEAYADILFFDDCIDSDDALNLMANWNLDAGPSSTTCKVMRSVAWAVKYYKFRYFFRLGDDSYLRIDKFLHMLEQDQLPAGKAVIGQILHTDILGVVHDFPQGIDLQCVLLLLKVHKTKRLRVLLRMLVHVTACCACHSQAWDMDSPIQLANSSQLLPLG